MLAEPSAQRTLLRLAEVDSAVARITHTAKTLPQHATIQRLMEERQHAGDALTAATTNADDLEVAARRAEQDLVPVRARLERNQERIDGGTITDAKALQGLIDEVQHILGRIEILEDEQLDAMGKAEEAAAQRDELAKHKLDVEAQLRAAVSERDAEVARLKSEAQAFVVQRPAVVKDLPEALVQLYERLRANTGLGAAKLEHGRCGGCRLELNVSDLQEITRTPANELVRCPECERILVRVDTN